VPLLPWLKAAVSTAPSERAHLTQSTVSQQIKRLGAQDNVLVPADNAQRRTDRRWRDLLCDARLPVAI